MIEVPHWFSLDFYQALRQTLVKSTLHKREAPFRYFRLLPQLLLRQRRATWPSVATLLLGKNVQEATSCSNTVFAPKPMAKRLALPSQTGAAFRGGARAMRYVEVECHWATCQMRSARPTSDASHCRRGPASLTGLCAGRSAFFRPSPLMSSSLKTIVVDAILYGSIEPLLTGGSD
jgi:hypothetical protein